jgi:hypothetical protein
MLEFHGFPLSLLFPLDGLFNWSLMLPLPDMPSLPVLSNNSATASNELNITKVFVSMPKSGTDAIAIYFKIPVYFLVGLGSRKMRG